MLNRIRKDVDLKELLKFGFTEVSNLFCRKVENNAGYLEGHDIVVNKDTRQIYRLKIKTGKKTKPDNYIKDLKRARLTEMVPDDYFEIESAKVEQKMLEGKKDERI